MRTSTRPLESLSNGPFLRFVPALPVCAHLTLLTPCLAVCPLSSRASKLNALVIFVEHRYYGSSLPFGPVHSFEQPGISFLNIEQALEDYAVIVTELQTSLGLTGSNAVPWIALGGSYGGVLSAWFRSKFPNLVAGALAASAPIKYLGPSLDYSFFQAATEDYAAISSTCPDAVKAGFEQLQGMVQEGQWAQIQADLQLCTEPTAETIEHVILWAVNSLLSLAQYDYPYPTNFSGAPLPGFPVTTACAMVNSPTSTTPLQALGQAVGLFYNGTGGASGGGTLSCFDPASEFIECADQTGCGLGPDGTAWDFQVCSQFVYLPCTNGVTDMFPSRIFSLEMLTTYCQAQYQVTPDPNILNIEFGGSSILQTASNIIFSNGALDPYHAGGFLPSAEGWKESEGMEGVRVSKYVAPGSEDQSGSNSSITLILIDLAAHHLDLRATNELDPISVTNARILELNTIIGWIDAFQPPSSNNAEIEEAAPIVAAAPAPAPIVSPVSPAVASAPAADASQIVASSSWLHVARAPASQLVSFTVALHHGDRAGIERNFQSVSDPRSARYLQYPSHEELVVMAQPNEEVLRQVESWVREDVCAGRLSSCSFVWTTDFKDAIKVTMAAAHAEEYLGRELHVYKDTKTSRNIVRSSLSSMDHLLPEALRPHVAYIHGLTSFPPQVRAHGARVDRNLNRVVQQEIAAEHSQRRINTLSVNSLDSALAVQASINVPRSSDSSLSSPSNQSRADSNMLQLGQIWSGDQSISIVLLLFSALEPNVQVCSYDPELNIVCPNGAVWQGATVVLTEADGHQSSFAISMPEHNTAMNLPQIATQFPLMRGNFAPVSISITNTFATFSISHTWPFTPAGSPLLSPELVKSLYNVPPALSATQSLSTKLGIGTLVVANKPGTHSGEGNYSPRDLDLFWSQAGLPGGPNAAWVDYSNPLQSNHPDIPDGETTLDIQIGAGVMASQSCLAQIYHVDSATPFDDIIQAVLADTQPPTALSFSYGQAESQTSIASMQYTNTRFQMLGLRRVSVIVSSGDTGAFQSQNPLDYMASCSAFGPSWPASSPFVTAVGASALVSDGTNQCPHEVQCSVETGSLITGGGGFSAVHAAQPYQLEAVNGWLQSSTCQALRPTTLAYNSSMRAFPDLVLLGQESNLKADCSQRRRRTNNSESHSLISLLLLSVSSRSRLQHHPERRL